MSLHITFFISPYPGHLTKWIDTGQHVIVLKLIDTEQIHPSLSPLLPLRAHFSSSLPIPETGTPFISWLPPRSCISSRLHLSSEQRPMPCSPRAVAGCDPGVLKCHEMAHCWKLWLHLVALLSQWLVKGRTLHRYIYTCLPFKEYPLPESLSA